jgi:maltooligosyltrehalose trehalohydrolase
MTANSEPFEQLGAFAEVEQPTLGARVVELGTHFGLFAEPCARAAVRFFAPDGTSLGDFAMQPLGGGYFGAAVPGVTHGALYKFVLDGRELTDPFARFLPQGVHGPAQVVANRFAWRHDGVSRPLAQQVIYELHVGTFSAEGTYAGVAARLPALAALGVTTIELLPVAAFPGRRGWGYDGVALYAPFAPYGTPDQLRALVDAAHGLGLGVLLDVVYNHFGPSGNYLPSYSPGFLATERSTGWGAVLDYTLPALRRAVVENARYWLDEFRFDGLRLDATHAIEDPSARHILRSIAEAARELPGKIIIAEDERNDPALVAEHGLDAIWADDFHHQVRVTLTEEKDGYYAAYRPGVSELARTIDRGWLYEGQVYGPTGRSRGTPAGSLAASAFVYCIQNHDQVGNRALGERLCATVSAEQYRAVSTLLLFLPMTPLLFMGQEWAASSPFLYFTDHDEDLGRLVREGRRREFEGFDAFRDPAARERIPDPQAEATFAASKLHWEERLVGEHARALALYRAALALRASDPVLTTSGREGLRAEAAGDVLVVRRTSPAGERVLLVNFSAEPVEIATLPIAPGLRPLLRSDLAPVTEPGAAHVLPAHVAFVLGT